MNLRITHNIDIKFVTNMIVLYLDSLTHDSKPTKSDFIVYMRHNVEQFGSSLDEYSNLQDKAYNMYGRWFG